MTEVISFININISETFTHRTISSQRTQFRSVFITKNIVRPNQFNGFSKQNFIGFPCIIFIYNAGYGFGF